MSQCQNITLETYTKEMNIRMEVHDVSVVLEDKLISEPMQLPLTSDITFTAELREEDGKFEIAECYKNNGHQDKTFWYKIYIYNNKEEKEEILTSDSNYLKNTIRANQYWEPLNSFAIDKSKILDSDSIDIVIRFVEARRRKDVYFTGDPNSEKIEMPLLLYDDDTFKDLFFLIDNGTVLSHKSVIAARSPKFYEMLDPQEKKEGLVTVKDVSFTTFKAFVKYLYTNQVDDIKEIAKDLLTFAVKYELPSLKKKCENYLSQTLNEGNAINLLVKADVSDCPILKKRSLFMIKPHLKRIRQSQEFKELYKHPHLMDEILESFCSDEEDEFASPSKQTKVEALSQPSSLSPVMDSDDALSD